MEERWFAYIIILNASELRNEQDDSAFASSQDGQERGRVVAYQKPKASSGEKRGGGRSAKALRKFTVEK